MDYCFKPRALHDLKSLPRLIQKKVIEKLDFYIQSEKPLSFAKSLQNKEFGEYRFRIGDHRVIFDYNSSQKTITILAIGHRKNIYK